MAITQLKFLIWKYNSHIQVSMMLGMKNSSTQQWAASADASFALCTQLSSVFSIIVFFN
jgi:hypothetical protein